MTSYHFLTDKYWPHFQYLSTLTWGGGGWKETGVVATFPDLTPEWCWFEEELSYDNAKMAHALIVSGRATGQPAVLVDTNAPPGQAFYRVARP